MKYMKTINEMQALVTKFRREVQRSEAPKLGFHVKTTGECKCQQVTVPPWVRRDCPLHGLPKVAPDPLHVRVAKANGKDVKYLEGVGLGKDGWYYWNPRAHGEARWVLIPRCDKIVDEAMEAFQEYAEKNRHPKLHIYPQMGGSSWCIDMDNCSIQPCGKNLALLICEAIVAHADKK